MPSLTGTTPGQTGTVEDLGGPTPQNYKVDDEVGKTKNNLALHLSKLRILSTRVQNQQILCQQV